MSSKSPSRAFMSIPDLVARNCETDPSRPFYIYAQPGSEEVTAITHLEFGRATHRAANILRPNREGQNGEVVAVLALSEPLSPFPLETRLLQSSGCYNASSCHRIIATCATLDDLLAGIKNHIAEVDPDFALQIEEVPSLQQVYPNLGAETADFSFHSYPTEVSHESLDEIALYIHSSGSTRFPRAVGQTHRVLKQWLALPAIAEVRDHLEHWGPIGAMALPSFHIFGVIQQLMQPLSGTCVAVYPPTATTPEAVPITPSPDSIIEHARKTKCRSLITVPVLLIAWFNSPPAIAYLKTLDRILFSGGPLPQRIGDALVNAGLNLICGYGATEFGPISTMIQNGDDTKEWAWFRVSPLVKVRWAPQGDDTFECQLLAWEHHTPMVHNLNGVRGYSTSDLCVNHSHKKHLWKLVGRLDDVIIHSSGEKTVPAPMEDIVMSSPLVAAAVMFGRERAQAGILIETPPNLQFDVQNDIKLAELRNKVWPIIEEANTDAPAFSRIFKEMVLFTSPDKPLPRAGKGTVMRKAALGLYAAEIEGIYDTVEGQTNITGYIEPPAVWNGAQIQELLLKLAKTLCEDRTISPSEDLFKQGFDSLTATVFRLRVMTALRSKNLANAANAITQNFVYSYPTISKLSTYLEELVGGTVEGVGIRESEMETLIAKYSCSGIAGPEAFAPSPSESVVVLLTGSTGNLGSQILASLLMDNRVLKIYAFNRPSGRPIADRHVGIFNRRGLDTLLLASPKLVYVEGEADQDNLGLKSALYQEMRTSITLIVHNAWTLDFNMVLSSFEPHILATRHLMDLALSSPNTQRFLFTSSIASAQGWDLSRGPCPEDILSDTSAAIGGYGQSKYVAEQRMSQILANSGLNVTCLRIGQVCGALPRGAWATTDWVAILVKTSISLGLLPLADGAIQLVSWIDFGTVAQAIMDAAFTPLEISERLPSVLNIVHPRPVSWNFVMSCIRDVLLKKSNTCKDLKLVRFPDWYKELEACEARGGRYVKEDLPGLKLLDFFSHLANSTAGSADAEFAGPTFSVHKIQALSPAMHHVSSITQENVQAWVDYWSASGFI
ncbi:putative aminoadipate reductase [Mycena vulgaris]|nr:putative aminoadipate reductase [Mycena vulgaris]